MKKRQVPAWVTERVVVWEEDAGKMIDRVRLSEAWSTITGTNFPAAATAIEKFVDDEGGLFLMFDDGHMYGTTLSGDFVAMTIEAAIEEGKFQHQEISFETSRIQERIAKAKMLGDGIARAIAVRGVRLAKLRATMRCVDCANGEVPTNETGNCAKCGNGGVMYVPKVAE